MNTWKKKDKRGQDPFYSSKQIVEEYLGRRLGAALASLRPGETSVVETKLRLQQERYGYVRSLWWLATNDGRSVVSVQPGARVRVAELVRNVDAIDAIHDPGMIAALREAMDEVLAAQGRERLDRAFADISLSCNSSLLRRSYCGDCRRIKNLSVPAAKGLQLPTHCFPNGVVYGVIEDGKVVSIAYAHPRGIMEDKLADVGVPGTAEPYRFKGYGKTVISALVASFTEVGGEAYYVCSPDNAASVATARSVGFISYGKSLVLGSSASSESR